MNVPMPTPEAHRAWLAYDHDGYRAEIMRHAEQAAADDVIDLDELAAVGERMAPAQRRKTKAAWA